MKLRGWGLLVVAAAITFALEFGWTAGGYALLVASFVLAIVFCVRNLERPGMAIILLGVALNAAVCIVDHGMPSSGPAFVGNVRHHHARAGERLLALSDTIALRPLHAVVSIGDLIVVFGAVAVVGVYILNNRRPELRTNRGETNAQVE